MMRRPAELAGQRGMTPTAAKQWITAPRPGLRSGQALRGDKLRQMTGDKLYRSAPVVTAFILTAFLVLAVVPRDLSADDLKPGAENPAGGSPAEAPESGEDWEEDWDEDWEDNWPPEGVPSSQVYSLDRCIRIALEKNREIRSAHWDVVYHDARAGEAWWAWFPKIEFKSVVAPAPNYNVPPQNDTGEFISYDPKHYSVGGVVWGNEIKITAPLYTFGKISALRDMGPMSSRAGRQKRKVVRERVVYEVTKAYVTLQLIEQMLDLLDEGNSRIGEAEKKLDELLESDSESVTDMDRYKFEVVRADLRARLEEAKKNRKIVERALKTLLDLPPDAPFYPERRLMKEPKKVDEWTDLEKITETMNANRPELKLLDTQLELARKECERQMAYWFPDFFLALSYNFVHTSNIPDIRNPFLRDPYNVNELIGMFGISYAFDTPLQYYRVRQSEAKLRRTEQTRRHYRDQMKLQIEEAFRSYHEKMNQMEINYEGGTAGKKWMISAFMSYNVGLLDSGEMVEAIIAYFKTSFYYHNSIHAALLAQARLRWLMGAQSDRYLETAAENRPPRAKQGGDAPEGGQSAGQPVP